MPAMDRHRCRRLSHRSRRHPDGSPGPGRSFDPLRLGALECRAWVTYYRREWAKLAVASVGLVRAGFRMGWVDTLHGAWLVLRANQRWAPYPDNDPAAARALMERFYRLVARSAGETLDAAEAARLEVAWWHAHRRTQHGEPATVGGGDRGSDDGWVRRQALVDAVADLYAFLYAAPLDLVRPAAAERAEAMRISDQWVSQGCSLTSPLVAAERAALVRSYAALLAAVHHPPPTPSLPSRSK